MFTITQLPRSTAKIELVFQLGCNEQFKTPHANHIFCTDITFMILPSHNLECFDTSFLCQVKNLNRTAQLGPKLGNLFQKIVVLYNVTQTKMGVWGTPRFSFTMNVPYSFIIFSIQEHCNRCLDLWCNHIHQIILGSKMIGWRPRFGPCAWCCPPLLYCDMMGLAHCEIWSSYLKIMPCYCSIHFFCTLPCCFK